ncbi:MULTISPECIES: hypothetical protein [Mesobacillus]|uniref:hypothetical protein n=1 Tax=Mesobacillus TaxID=2675231 RepID=UPI0017804E8F|nr:MULTISPECIES: hypothetical protein [Mesobacillus]MCM3574212.1 hypothetical protein [Mesobacillus subterraneus]UYZ20007.1 hypothetical protein FOF60_12985 [Mesobacillus jeotgali]
MILTWEPNWYELDQTIIVSDIDYFYLDKDEKTFANDFTSSEDKEVRGEIIKITHRELGELLGVLTIGLSYKFFLKDGKFIQVDAEENIGQIDYPNNIKVNDWLFNVELNVLEVTGLSSQERTKRTMSQERVKLEKERKERYKRLLNIDYL